MFRFADRNIVFWPVTLRQATPEGDIEEVEVRFAYRLLDRTQLRARERDAFTKVAERLVRAAPTGEGEASPGTTPVDLIAAFDSAIEREDGDVQFLLEHVTDWRGIADGDAPVAFSREHFAALLEFDVYFKPIMAGLHEASRAGPLKNSLPGPGGTPARVQA